MSSFFYLDQGRSASKWSLSRNSLHPRQGCKERFRRGAERCTAERSRETRAVSRRALPRRQLSLRQRHRGRLSRTAVQRRLTARPPHARPRGTACHPRPQRQLAGLLSDCPLWDLPGAGGPGDRGNLRFWLCILRAAGNPVPRSSGGAVTARDSPAPHAWLDGDPSRSLWASSRRSFCGWLLAWQRSATFCPLIESLLAR